VDHLPSRLVKTVDDLAPPAAQEHHAQATTRLHARAAMWLAPLDVAVGRAILDLNLPVNAPAETYN
jgi:hypothetical protein